MSERVAFALKSILKAEILLIAGYAAGVTAGGIFVALALLPYLVRGG